MLIEMEKRVKAEINSEKNAKNKIYFSVCNADGMSNRKVLHN